MGLGLGVVSGLHKEMGCSNGLHNEGPNKGKARAGLGFANQRLRSFEALHHLEGRLTLMTL